MNWQPIDTYSCTDDSRKVLIAWTDGETRMARFDADLGWVSANGGYDDGREYIQPDFWSEIPLTPESK